MRMMWNGRGVHLTMQRICGWVGHLMTVMGKVDMMIVIRMMDWRQM